MNRALFERNAKACEEAKYATCTCACGGQFHGTKHEAAWINATWAEIEGAIKAARPHSLDLFAGHIVKSAAALSTEEVKGPP